jgi:DNA-binding transcriptional LysR family regulator
VRDRARELGLLVEPGSRRAIIGERRADDLQREHLVELEVACAIHASHPALAEAPVECIPPAHGIHAYLFYEAARDATSVAGH